MSYIECVELWKSKSLIEKKEMLIRFGWKFTYGSNKIENSNTHLKDVEDIFNSRTINTKSDITKKTENEIRNHKAVLKEITKGFLADTMGEITIDKIKKLHLKLMSGCYDLDRINKGEHPGEFKKGDYVVGLHDVGASPEDVITELESLLEEVNEVGITPNNSLKVVAYFHCWFESIHPFADGNGRLGRLLLNYILLANDLPPIILFDRDRNQYYLALEEFTESQEIQKMVDFLEMEAEKTWLKDYNTKVKKLSVFLD